MVDERLGGVRERPQRAHALRVDRRRRRRPGPAAGVTAAATVSPCGSASSRRWWDCSRWWRSRSTAATGRARARAWNAVALFAGGGVVCGYGLLARLLCAAGPSCSSTRSGLAIGVGAAIAAVGLVLLTHDVTRR